MNEFVSWCRHLLVSFLFHALTSLHPPSFHRNDFSTCSTHFSFKMFSLRSAHVDFMHAHAHAENLHVHAHKWRRSVSAVEEPHEPRSTIGMYGERKTNARYPCTPQSTVETFGEEISAEACSSKEIAGLLRKMMMMMNTSGKIISMK